MELKVEAVFFMSVFLLSLCSNFVNALGMLPFLVNV